MRMSPEYCPHCGAEVPANVKACPECGSDEKTGWSDRAHADRLGIPDEEFNYDEFIKEEFGEKRESRIKPSGVKWPWWVVAIAVLLTLLTLIFR